MTAGIHVEFRKFFGSAVLSGNILQPGIKADDNDFLSKPAAPELSVISNKTDIFQGRLLPGRPGTEAETKWGAFQKSSIFPLTVFTNKKTFTLKVLNISFGFTDYILYDKKNVSDKKLKMRY